MISNYLDQSGQAHHNNNAVTVTKPIENKKFNSFSPINFK